MYWKDLNWVFIMEIAILKIYLITALNLKKDEKCIKQWETKVGHTEIKKNNFISLNVLFIYWKDIKLSLCK